MAIYCAQDLDALVAECDAHGGINTPAAAALLQDFEFRYETSVDQSLDPFSDDYFQAQVRLYTEITGRKLDQDSGELTPINVAAHAAAANPYNSRDVRFLAKHNRAVLTALVLADLPPAAEVLDAGSGWGLSSEAFARCGASVTAVDINPLFADLVRQRATRLDLPIDSIRSGFDTFASTKRFDLLFFYECLHHSVKPWETLAHMAQFVKPEGKIVFAGEPINGIWWKHWGLRLDGLSIYCMRKFGWWESGWTGEFIAACYARAGYTLELHAFVGLDNGHVGVAIRPGTSRGNLAILEPFYQMQAQHQAATHAADVELDRLRLELQETAQSLAAMRASRSWRVTAPLRNVYQTLGRRRAA